MAVHATSQAWRRARRSCCVLVLGCCAAVSGADTSQAGAPPAAPAAAPWSTGPQARTPPWLEARCSVAWTSSVGKYQMPYSVEFGSDGSFRWWAPLINRIDGLDEEAGLGVYLTPPLAITREDGSWETGYFAANRFTPDPANSTLCTCEYQGQAGPGEPRVLADYFVAMVPDSQHLPMEQACAPYIQQCPIDNATASRLLGKPFIEIYTPCSPLNVEAPRGVGVVALVLLVTFMWPVVYACHNAVCEEYTANKEPEDEAEEKRGYLWLGDGPAAPSPPLNKGKGAKLMTDAWATSSKV